MFRKSGFVIIVLFFVSISPVLAQSEKEKAVTRLTNNNSKQWVVVGIDTYMGGKKKCTKGEKWEFLKTGKVNIVKCVNGELIPTETNWTLEATSALDLTITVGIIKYTLIFPLKNQKEMILRIPASQIGKKTIDLKFYSEVD